MRCVSFTSMLIVKDTFG